MDFKENLKKEIEKKIKYINFLIKKESKKEIIEKQRRILDDLLEKYIGKK